MLPIGLTVAYWSQTKGIAHWSHWSDFLNLIDVFSEYLRMLRTIIGLFFTHFQVKFLRNLATEIIIIVSKYVVQLLRKLPLLFRTSDTSTYDQKMVFTWRP